MDAAANPAADPRATPRDLLHALNARDDALTAQHDQLVRALQPGLSERHRSRLQQLAQRYAAVDRVVDRTRKLLEPFARVPMPTPAYMRADATVAFTAIAGLQHATAAFLATL